MKTKKRMNAYVKALLFLLGGAVIGGIVGGTIAILDGTTQKISAEWILELLRGQLFPVILILTLALVLGGEYTIRRMRTLGKGLEDAEEDYEEREEAYEKAGSDGMIFHTIISVLSLMALATGYSMEYIKGLDQTESMFLLATFFIFLLQAVYQGIWQIRYVKLIQQQYPERFENADPSSRKFQEQWLASCDEAEKNNIYQAAYQSHITVTKFLPALTVLAMLFHMIWNTGILAVFLLGLVWIISTVTYCRNARGAGKSGRVSIR